MHHARNFILISCLCLPGDALDAAEVRLRSNAVVNNAVVRLSDLAEITGADQGLAARLDHVEIVPAPPAGVERCLSVRMVQDFLQEQGFNLAELRFSGASRTTVETAGHATRPDSDASRNHGRGAAPRFGAERPSRQYMVVRSLGPLSRGAVIRPGDVELIPSFDAQELGRGGHAFHTLEEIIGQEVTRSVPAGKVLSRNAVSQQTLVRRGDEVSVVVHLNGIRIRATAKAAGSGGMGEWITVETLDRNRRERYEARITGPQQVEVVPTARR